MLEATERQLGVSAVAGLRARLPPRLAAHASLDRLRASAALDTVPLDEGEEVLLAVDSLLGDGSGKLLETIGADLATRVLSQGGGVVRTGDLYGTVARLQAFLEHPFVGVTLVFEHRRTPTGFALTVGVLGHSRATRALRHLAIGTILAAERFAREAGAENLKLYADNIGDRSNISARYLEPESTATEEAPPPSRRPHTVRPPSPSLSDEVDRILRTPSQRAPDSERAIESQRAAETSRSRASFAPPRAPRELEEALPESATLPRSDSRSMRAVKKPGGSGGR